MTSKKSNLATPSFVFRERRGPASVGLDVVELYDYSRTFGPSTDAFGRPSCGERARPLQTLVWYPARPGEGTPMTVGDYLDLWASETIFGAGTLPERAREWRSAMHAALASPMGARRNAKPATGHCPLVIYAPSFSSTSWENADLCEYLASWGYMVLACPNMGANTRAMTLNLEGLDAQSRDISFLIGYAKTLANVDSTNIAVVGFSWGGLSNVFAAARDTRIRALVALDGSLRYHPNLVAAAGVDPTQMTLPLLYFARSEWTLEGQARFFSATQLNGPNVLNAWTHGDVVTVRMMGMTHRDFSSMFQRNADVWADAEDEDFPDARPADFGREDGIDGYGWMARYTRRFLDAYLKGDPDAKQYLLTHPTDNGVPPRFMSVTCRPAQGGPASFVGFRAEIGRQGFDRTSDIYRQKLAENPAFTLTEVDLSAWAEELLDRDCSTEAVTLLELNLEIHPQSTAAHASLGRAYEKSGDATRATEHYRAALSTAMFNAEANRRLRKLEGRERRNP